MPSSSELVATTAGSSPALSSDSVRVRSARLIEPWWARARIVAASPGVDADGRARLRRDRGGLQRRRVGHVLALPLGPDLVHPRGEPLGAAAGVGEDEGRAVRRPRGRPRAPRRAARSTARAAAGPAGRARTSVQVVGASPVRCRAGPTGPGPGRRRRPRSAWSTAAARRRPARPPSAGARAPPRNAATASTGRTVADRPMRCAGRDRRGGRAGRRAARARGRGARRAWCRRRRGSRRRSPSRTPASPARAADVSTRYSDSGVVMRMSGGFVANARRSFGGVSPVRMPTRDVGQLAARAGSAACRMPTSGERRLRSTSVASALSGETYRTRQRCDGVVGPLARSSRPSSAQRNAARVLPEPVGATTSAWSPPATAVHAPTCAVVGSANAPVNQVLVGSEKRSSTTAAIAVGRHRHPRAPQGGRL